MEINTNSLKISENIWLFILPIFIYSSIYAFELGYADYFGIPYTMVIVNLSEYIAYSLFITIIFILTIVLFGITGLAMAIYENNKLTKSKYFWGLLIRTVPYIFILNMVHDTYKNLFDLLLYSLVFLFYVLIIFLFDKAYFWKNLKGIKHTEKDGNNKEIGGIEQRKEEIPYILKWMNPENKRKYFIISILIQIIIFTVMIFFILGNMRARTKTIYHSYSNGQEIIIAIYGNSYFTKSRKNSKYHDYTFKMVDRETILNQEITYTDITK